MTEAVAHILSQLNTLTPQERVEAAYEFLRSLKSEEPGRQVPAENWDEALRLLDGLKNEAPPIRTGADLLRAGVIGLWSDRDDLGDSCEFAHRLRQQSETRPGAIDAA